MHITWNGSSHRRTLGDTNNILDPHLDLFWFENVNQLTDPSILKPWIWWPFAIIITWLLSFTFRYNSLFDCTWLIWIFHSFVCANSSWYPQRHRFIITSLCIRYRGTCITTLVEVLYGKYHNLKRITFSSNAGKHKVTHSKTTQAILIFIYFDSKNMSTILLIHQSSDPLQYRYYMTFVLTLSRSRCLRLLSLWFAIIDFVSILISTTSGKCSLFHYAFVIVHYNSGGGAL